MLFCFQPGMSVHQLGSHVNYFGLMKHNTRSLVLVPMALCFSVSAQITIDAPDMPSAGDTVRFQTTTTTADIADTGPAHLWDFSALVPGGEGADTMVTVGSTPLLYQFFFNNAILYPQHKADFAMRGVSIGIQGFSLDDLFDYYKSNSTGYRNVGFGANLNGLPTSVQRDPVDWIYRFPMNYGDTDSSASHFQVSVPMLGFYGQEQMRRNEVDGWGTLILPADTFQVLRVKSRIARTDTIYISQFGFGLSIPEPETIEYKWIAQGMDEPVLQVITVGGINTVVRFHYDPEDITTGIAAHTTAATLKAWPNPVSNLLHLEGTMNSSLEVIAMDGRHVLPVPVGARSVDVTKLPPGTYSLRSATNGAALRFMIVR